MNKIESPEINPDMCSCVLFIYLFFIHLFILALLGFELMLAKQVLYHLSHSTSPVLCWVFFRGSHELFARAGFES
jgi:hypothetical protein